MAWPGQALWAIGIDDFPAHAPNEQVDDGADVLSRAAITELQKKLELFSQA
ncbi:MAG: TPM domain-containing protein, partial [Actinobacteria bacterium]|nr:TPM domain-containing protein [Actinomycetota bacterium]